MSPSEIPRIVSLAAVLFVTSVACKPKPVATSQVREGESPAAEPLPPGEFHYPESEANGWGGACLGALQSPIHLSREFLQRPKALAKRVRLRTNPTAATVHVAHGAVKVAFQHDGTPATPHPGVLTIDQQNFYLQQFHFHTPSEHVVDGQQHDMEMHFVFGDKPMGNPDRAIALGFFFKAGAAHDGLGKLIARLPATATGQTHAAVGGGASGFDRTEGAEAPGSRFALNGAGGLATTVDPAEFIPARLDAPFWAYQGSLTTPPCAEIVTHVVHSEPLVASATQVTAMRMGATHGTARAARRVDNPEVTRRLVPVTLSYDP